MKHASRYAVNKSAYIFGLVLLSFVFVTASAAQTANNSSSVQQPSDEEELIKPGRPGVANPAEFQKPGILQIESAMTEILAPTNFARSKPRRLTCALLRRNEFF